MRDGNGIPSSSQREPTVIPSISNSPSKSLSVNQEEAEAGASSSTSASEEPRARTREDADGDVDALLRFLYQHRIKIARPDVSKLIDPDDGFDLDTVFWMIEKTEIAEPNDPTAYFRAICEDKQEKGATTIAAIRHAECDSNADFEIFNRHLDFWRKEYHRFKGAENEP